MLVREYNVGYVVFDVNFFFAYRVGLHFAVQAGSFFKRDFLASVTDLRFPRVVNELLATVQVPRSFPSETLTHRSALHVRKE